ncbi:protein BTG4-like [Engystomops pustulosus]|uniref:protein BTG4-like n=1 Tax=Engystomops pustulosus TaxID=76066 RepID=UPI003AFA8A37
MAKYSFIPLEMREELLAGVRYMRTLANRFRKLDPVKVEKFGEHLLEIVSKKFTGHWFPEEPMKDRAYRCIRVIRNDREETILEACVHSGLDYQDLDLPKEMTMWIDPYEVSCRLHEYSRPYTVATFDPRKPRHPLEEGQVAAGFGPATRSTPPLEDDGSTPRQWSQNVEEIWENPVPLQAPRPVFRTASPLWIPGWRAPQFFRNSPEVLQQGFWVQAMWVPNPHCRIR